MLETVIKKLTDTIEKLDEHIIDLIQAQARHTPQNTLKKAEDPFLKKEDPLPELIPEKQDSISESLKQAPPTPTERQVSNAPPSAGLPPGGDTLTDMQKFAMQRVAEVSAELGRADVMQGLMAYHNISDLRQVDDVALREFLSGVETARIQTLEVMKKGAL